MTLVHTQTDGNITYCLFIQPEHIPVRGNALVSGDDKEERKAERSIERQLAKGNLWAWCAVTVEARHNDYPDVRGVDHLGACSYRNTKDFIHPSDYWGDMKQVAKEDLMAQVLGGKA